MDLFEKLGIDPDAICRHIEGAKLQEAISLFFTMKENTSSIAGLVKDIIDSEVAQWQHYRVEDMADEPLDIRVHTQTMRLLGDTFGLCSDTAENIMLGLLADMSSMAARLDVAEKQLNTRGLN
jgi:hypothetical protein